MKYIIVILVFTFQYVLAQPGNHSKEGATFTISGTESQFIRATSKSLPKVKGTVYINDNWEQAEVKTLTQKKVVKLLARFNAYSKEIEILKEEDFVALEPIEGISVILNGKKFIPFKPNSSEKTIFAESMVKGKLSLIKVYDVKIVKAVSDASLLNVENEDRVRIIEKLYFENSDDRIERLPKKKKEILSIFDNQTQVFIRKEKMFLKKDEDLIRAFQYYNEKVE